ncbi:hypothetical protein GCM10020001_030500 [Nonomuraea salmonea]
MDAAPQVHDRLPTRRASRRAGAFERGERPVLRAGPGVVAGGRDVDLFHESPLLSFMPYTNLYTIN